MMMKNYFEELKKRLLISISVLIIMRLLGYGDLNALIIGFVLLLDVQFLLSFMEGFPTSSIGGTSCGSSVPNSEPIVNHPPENPPEPVAPNPEVYHPLLEDEDRRQELDERLDKHAWKPGFKAKHREQIVNTQLQIEKKMEKALLSDGYTRDSLLKNRDKIRGLLFYYRGNPFVLKTYQDHDYKMFTYGTHRCAGYKRIMNAIYNYDLPLERSRSKRIKKWEWE
jgi:hypothetical protein